MIGKYSLHNVMRVYNKNKPLITAYINGHSVEGLNEDSENSAEVASYGGITMVIFMVVIHIILFIWAAIAIYTHWNRLNGFLQVLSLVLLLTGGSVFSLILVYVASDKKDKYKPGSGNYGNYGNFDMDLSTSHRARHSMSPRHYK
jgi:ABC-type maltose transport system permease subunit